MAGETARCAGSEAGPSQGRSGAWLRGAASWGLIGSLCAVGCAIERAPATDKAWLEAATIEDVLAAVGPAVVLPALARFSTELDGLSSAIQDWDGRTGPEQDAALASFASTMAVWQELELMQIGPAASSLTSEIGEDQRDEVYSWPTTNPCRVDQVTVGEDWRAASFQSDNLVNAYGLDALEHVLVAGVDNACPNQVDINADGTWDALGADGLAENRAAFALALTDLMQAQAAALAQAWDPAGGDLSSDLAAGSAGSLGSEQASMNAVYDALFYIYSATTHLKLETPLGLRDCAADDCTETVELAESGLSTAAIAANLRGFRALFTGGGEVGMDDLLTELGHGDLARDILDDTDEALALAEGLEMPLDEAIATHPEEVAALHVALKSLGDALKLDVATVLSLEVPAEAAGDND